MRNSGPPLPSFPALAAGLVALLVLLSPACRGAEHDPTPTAARSPTPPPTAPPPTATPVPPPNATDFRFVYSRFGNEEDVVWMVNPAAPKKRVEVARLPHEPGWPVKATLSPDGTKIAYVAMRAAGTQPAYQADAFVLDLEEENELLATKRVAEFVDLGAAPRWSPDGQLVYLRQNIENFVGVIMVDLRELPPPGPTATPIPEDAPPPVRTVLFRHNSRALDYTTLGFDPEEPILYFVQIQGGTQGGSYLGRYEPATGGAVATATAVADATATAVDATATALAETATPVPTPTPTPGPSPLATPTAYPDVPGDVFLVLSDQIGHDYDLSPDATRVCFSVQGLSEGEFVTRTYVADIPGLQVEPLAAPQSLSGDQLRPTWHPKGDRISFGRLPRGEEPGGVVVLPLGEGEADMLAAPEAGFDEPVAWAPDGKFLVVNHFSGDSLANPGVSSLVFISANGRRVTGGKNVEMEPVGWLAPEEGEGEG